MMVRDPVLISTVTAMPGERLTKLVRPLGIIFPGAEAMMSTLPRDAQAKARQNSTTMVKLIAPPSGDGGVSTISVLRARTRARPCRVGLPRAEVRSHSWRSC
jgi:hypothetical protein